MSSLEQKGLVYTIPKDIKEFGAKPASVIREKLREHKDKLKVIDKKIKELEKIPKSGSKGKIIVVEGKRGFEELIKNMPEINTPFGYEVLWKVDTNPSHLRSLKKALKDKKIIKTLIDKNAPKENIDVLKKYQPEFKRIEANGVAMGITNNTCLISIIETNQTVFIESKHFAKVMKQLFEAYYDENL